MAFTVIYDACVLYPAPLRDLLMRIAVSGVVRAHWSDRILSECFASLAQNRPDISRVALQSTRERMCAAIPDGLVTAAPLVSLAIRLPDPNDLHVLEAAVACGAQAIVTFNLRHFPPQATTPFGIEAKHPDDFVLDAIGLAPVTLTRITEQQAAALRNPPRSSEELLETLAQQGLPQSVELLRTLIGVL